MKEVVRATHAVEGGGIEGGVDVVGTGNGVGSEEGDDLEGRESSGIVEPLQDLSNVVLGLRDQTVNGGGSRVGATGTELELRSTLSDEQSRQNHNADAIKEAVGTYRAVAYSDRTSELYEVTSRDLRELRQEGDQVVDRVGDTEVREERGLDGREDEHRAVSSSTTARQNYGQRQAHRSKHHHHSFIRRYSRRGALAARDGDGIICAWG